VSGGAGYVLSRAALHRFATSDRHNISYGCRQEDVAGNEDIEMTRCLLSCGVKMGYSTDSTGLDRFTSGPLHLILNPYINKDNGDSSDSHMPAWCCSHKPISFHSIPGKVMTVLNYFIYQLKIHNTVENIQHC
jgi:hypothetical protein